MAATVKTPSLDASHFAGKSRARKLLFLGSDSMQKWAPTAIRAGFEFFNLPYELEASSAKSVMEVDEKMRESGVCGGFVDLEQSEYMVGEAEYVKEEEEETLAANLVVKDEFSDLHVHNTYSTVYSQLLAPQIESLAGKKALVLGTTSLGRIAHIILEQHAIFPILWNHTDPSSVNFSELDFSDVILIINALPANIDPPALPEAAFRQNVTIIDNSATTTENTLIEAAKKGKSTIVTGIEFHFEALNLAFHTFIAPLGRPPKPLPAATQSMVKAVLLQLGGDFEKQPPALLAQYLS